MRRLIIAVFTTLLLLVGCQQTARPLKPIRPVPTAVGGVVSANPEPVTFTTLANSPGNYLNQTLRVSGSYVQEALPACPDYKGPVLYWGLIDESLKMGAVGYESILSIVPDGTQMTVDGVWKLYRGPVGCGKEPPEDAVWYLDVAHIIQPNPITQVLSDNPSIVPTSPPVEPDDSGGSTDDGQEGEEEEEPVEGEEEGNNTRPPEQTADTNPVTPPTPTQVIVNSPTLPPTNTPTTIPSATPTTPRNTPTLVPQTATPTPTASPTATDEPDDDEPDDTPEPEPTDRPTRTPTSTPSPTATATPTLTPTADQSPPTETATPTPTPTNENVATQPPTPPGTPDGTSYPPPTPIPSPTEGCAYPPPPCDQP